MRLRQAHLVPAGVWHAHLRREPPDRSAQQSEPRRPRIFLAALEEQLHADAEPEQRNATRGLAHRRIEAARGELARAVAEVTDTRQDDRARGSDHRRVIGHGDLTRSRAAERPLDVRQVAHAIVDDGDHPIRPFELGTPARRGSRRVAASSARPKALNAASSRWCVFPPASWRMWSAHFAPCANAAKKSGTSVESNEPTMRSDGARSDLKNGRPPRSSATETRHSSMGISSDA